MQKDNDDVKSDTNAIILAAGFGMRMVPINTHVPKGLLRVDGEPIIERLIKQLNAVGVDKIYIVVGYMADQFAYLSEMYNVELIYNDEYASKNNLFSLKLALDKLSNTYIVPSDIWCRVNPFSRNETTSWYMVSNLVDNDSNVRVNKYLELKRVPCNIGGNSMVGIAYIDKKDAVLVRKRIERCCSNSKHDDDFWEDVLYENGKMFIHAKPVSLTDVVEINTYEQLRELDCDSDQLKSDALEIIAKVFAISQSNITDIQVLKKGMTNRSFCFTVDGSKYIMRIPGEGTNKLINRGEESEVYEQIKDRNICDDIVYINSSNGYKITKYIDGSRICNPFNVKDLKICMDKLCSFHEMALHVDHDFDIFKQLEFYESLWGGVPSVHKDYLSVKEKVYRLKPFIENNIDKMVLSHIDAVPDNFLFVGNEVRLIDWEYAGMQDPHIDIAMFSIYALYNKRQIDRLINIYFNNVCPQKIRIKIYCYIAVCGLLWSNWCEYKRSLGIEFGDYAAKQYWYAKHYYNIAVREMQRTGCGEVV